MPCRVGPIAAATNFIFCVPSANTIRSSAAAAAVEKKEEGPSACNQPSNAEEEGEKITAKISPRGRKSQTWGFEMRETFFRWFYFFFSDDFAVVISICPSLRQSSGK